MLKENKEIDKANIPPDNLKDSYGRRIVIDIGDLGSAFFNRVGPGNRACILRNELNLWACQLSNGDYHAWVALNSWGEDVCSSVLIESENCKDVTPDPTNNWGILVSVDTCEERDKILHYLSRWHVIWWEKPITEFKPGVELVHLSEGAIAPQHIQSYEFREKEEEEEEE